MVDDREKLTQIISEEAIMERVHQIADDISNRYKGEVPILIGCLLYTSPSPRDRG